MVLQKHTGIATIEGDSGAVEEDYHLTTPAVTHFFGQRNATQDVYKDHLNQGPCKHD